MCHNNFGGISSAPVAVPACLVAASDVGSVDVFGPTGGARVIMPPLRFEQMALIGDY